MKAESILLTLVITLTSLNASAQSNVKKHLDFNGIAITGHIREMEMKINAFTPLTLYKMAKDNSSAVFSLPASAASDPLEPSDLLVYASGKSSTVWNITAYYPEQEDRDLAIIQYLYVKDILTETYGEAEDVVENDEKYSCWFNKSEGSVCLEINKDGQVCADYFDTMGVDLYFDEM